MTASPEKADPEPKELEELEIRLLVEAVHAQYGYDFAGYVPSTLTRRIREAAHAEGLPTITSLTNRVLHDPVAFERLLTNLLVQVTSMFRNPAFFAAFRSKVVPFLQTFPFVRIWVAGCSTGEELYSLAILLEEEDLMRRSRIYATDMSQAALKQAATGIMPLDRMKSYTNNYQAAGGTRSFSDYYTARYGHARMNASLTTNVFFAAHNLATDSSFNVFHVVMCRNVLIYFDRLLQDRAIGIFSDSLMRHGVLALGEAESLRFSKHANDFEALDSRRRIYRKAS